MDSSALRRPKVMSAEEKMEDINEMQYNQLASRLNEIASVDTPSCKYFHETLCLALAAQNVISHRACLISTDLRQHLTLLAI